VAIDYSKYLAVDPYGYQKDGVDFILRHHYGIIGDEMGLGKSLQAIALMALSSKKSLVVCPSYLKRNWEFEIQKIAPQLSTNVCESKHDFKRNESRVNIVSYSQLKYATEVFTGVRLVVADECHYLKNPEAKRTQLFHDFLERVCPDYGIFLSGTAIKNRVEEYYSILSLCSYNPRRTSGKDVLKDFSYQRFRDTFQYKEKFKIGRRFCVKYSGIRNRPLLREYLHSKYIRRTADKVLDLPKMYDKEVMVDYSTYSDELRKAWEHQNTSKDHVSSAKKNSAIAKAPFTIEYAKDLKTTLDGPILIFTDHPDAGEIIAEGLGKKVELIRGKTATKKRYKIVEKFQRCELEYLVCTIGAGSTGFNLTATNHAIFNDESWVPADNWQAKKRIHRIGQRESCIIHKILGSKLDLMISRNLTEKEATLREAL